MCEHCDDIIAISAEPTSENIKELCEQLIVVLMHVVDTIDDPKMSRIVELDVACDAMRQLYTFSSLNGPVMTLAIAAEQMRIAKIAAQN